MHTEQLDALNKYIAGNKLENYSIYEIDGNLYAGPDIKASCNKKFSYRLVGVDSLGTIKHTIKNMISATKISPDPAPALTCKVRACKHGILVLTSASQPDDLEASGYWSDHYNTHMTHKKGTSDCLLYNIFVWLGNEIKSINKDTYEIEYGEKLTTEYEKINNQHKFLTITIPEYFHGPRVIMTTANKLNEEDNITATLNTTLNTKIRNALAELAADSNTSLLTYDSTQHISDEVIGFYGIIPTAHTHTLLSKVLADLHKLEWIAEESWNSYNTTDYCTIIFTREDQGALKEKRDAVNQVINNVYTFRPTDDERQNNDFQRINEIFNSMNCTKVLIIGLTISSTLYANNWAKEIDKKQEDIYITSTDINITISNLLNTGLSSTNYIRMVVGWDYITNFIAGLSMGIYDLCNYKIPNNTRPYNIGNSSTSTTTTVVEEAATGEKTCKSINVQATDDWCNLNCNHNPPFCPPDFCTCDSVSPAPTTPAPGPGGWRAFAAANNIIGLTEMPIIGSLPMGTDYSIQHQSIYGTGWKDGNDLTKSWTGSGPAQCGRGMWWGVKEPQTIHFCFEETDKGPTGVAKCGMLPGWPNNEMTKLVAQAKLVDPYPYSGIYKDWHHPGKGIPKNGTYYDNNGKVYYKAAYGADKELCTPDNNTSNPNIMLPQGVGIVTPPPSPMPESWTCVSRTNQKGEHSQFAQSGPLPISSKYDGPGGLCNPTSPHASLQTCQQKQILAVPPNTKSAWELCPLKNDSGTDPTLLSHPSNIKGGVCGRRGNCDIDGCRGSISDEQTSTYTPDANGLGGWCPANIESLEYNPNGWGEWIGDVRFKEKGHYTGKNICYGKGVIYKQAWCIDPSKH